MGGKLTTKAQALAFVARRVFISYRRQLSWPLADLIRKDLVEHDFDVFVDRKNLDSGEFEQTILSEIWTRWHFIVLLEPGSLDRIGEPGDWMRREIAYALAHRRNVVPVTARGFEFHRNPQLPQDVERLPKFNAVPIPSDYPEDGMKRLRKRFLKMQPDPASFRADARPAPRSDQRARATQAPTRPVKPSRAGAPVLPAPQLTGRIEWRQMQLTWSEVSGAENYVLERTMSDPSVVQQNFVEVYRGPGRRFCDTAFKTVALLHETRTWRYRVRASARDHAGKWSDVLQLEELPLIPGRQPGAGGLGLGIKWQ